MQKETHDYLEWKAATHERAAVVYRKYVLHFEQHVGKPRLVRDIMPVVKWQQSWKARNRDPYYPTVVIKNFLKWMRAQGYPVLDPWLVRLPKRKQKRRASVTEAEFQAMEKVCSFTYLGVRDKLLLHLLWHTGARVSEICSLNLEDLGRNGDGGKATIKNKKNEHFRTILWPKETQDLLHYYLGVRLCESTNPALFSGNSGRLCTKQVQRIIASLAKKAGIVRRVTPHQLRHGWSLYRLKRGADIMFIKKGLGHLDIRSSTIYLNETDVAFEKEGKRYFNRLSPHLEK